MPRSIESFVDEIATALEREKLLGEVPVVRRKVRSVVYKCGSKRRTQPFLDSIEAGLAEAGVFVDPDITDIDLGLDTYVRFTLEPPLPVGRIFKPERALAYHLSKWPSSLEQALPKLGRLKHHHGGSKPERKYWLEGMELKPDLVFSSGSGAWLVCELERGDPKNESVDQLEYYIRALAMPKRQTVGVLITGSPRAVGLKRQMQRRLQRLNDEGFDAHWLTYDVEVALTLRQ